MSQHDMVLDNAAGAAYRADNNDALQALASTSKGSSRPSTAYAGQHWVDEDTPSSTVWTENVYDGVGDIPAARIDTTNDRCIPYNAAHGQCRLTKSGSNLLLSPVGGNVLIINGAPEVIPSAGVTLAPTALSSNTTYFIYAYMNSGTLTLEASTTGHATDTTTGVEIKSGDATRTLVGMARIIAGPAWADTAAQRFVLSYFNRRTLQGRSAFTANRATTSSSYAEINSEIRSEFLTWADEAVDITACGGLGISSAQVFATSIGIDDATAEDTYCTGQAFTASATCGFANTLQTTLSEGYHYATLLGQIGGGATATFHGGSAGGRSTVGTVVRG
jgi:hypothetical protein